MERKKKQGFLLLGIILDCLSLSLVVSVLLVPGFSFFLVLPLLSSPLLLFCLVLFWGHCPSFFFFFSFFLSSSLALFFFFFFVFFFCFCLDKTDSCLGGCLSFDKGRKHHKGKRARRSKSFHLVVRKEWMQVAKEIKLS